MIHVFHQQPFVGLQSYSNYSFTTAFSNYGCRIRATSGIFVLVFEAMIRLESNFVPVLYRRPGKVGFLALLAERNINNLRGINIPLEFDSVPGHHINAQ